MIVLLSLSIEKKVPLTRWSICVCVDFVRRWCVERV